MGHGSQNITLPSSRSLFLGSVLCAVLVAATGGVAALAWLDVALGAYALLFLMAGGWILLPIAGAALGIGGLILTSNPRGSTGPFIGIAANVALAVLLYVLGAIFLKE